MKIEFRTPTELIVIDEAATWFPMLTHLPIAVPMISRTLTFRIITFPYGARAEARRARKRRQKRMKRRLAHA